MTRIASIDEAMKGAAADIARASEPPETGELFALPCDDPTGEIETARQAGFKGGRPKGAQNIATRELRAWLLQRGGLPQQAMMEWLTLGPIGLAKALGCTRLEAFDRWAGVAKELGRYFMAPMVPVDGEGKPAPQFIVQIGGQSGVLNAAGEIRPPWEYLDLEAEQNQELTQGGNAPPKEEEP